MATLTPQKPVLVNPVVVKKPLAKVWGGFDDAETEKVQTSSEGSVKTSFKFDSWIFSEKQESFPASGSLSFSETKPMSEMAKETATKTLISATEGTVNVIAKGAKNIDSIAKSVKSDILKDLIFKQILGLGIEKPKEKTPEQQKKEAEAQFTRQRQQAIDSDIKKVVENRRQSLAQKILMISNGQMSLTDVFASKNVNVVGMAGDALLQNIGESDIHFAWRQRQEQKKKAEEAKKKADTKTPGKSGLSELNKRYEGAGTMGTDAVG